MRKKDRTTGEHFKIFQEEAWYWIQRFGLKGWNIHYTHENTDNESFATCAHNVSGRVVTLNLEKDWEDFLVTERQVRQSAFHEVIHILLARLRWLAIERAVGIGDVDQEIETIIRTLENAVWEPEQERKCQPQG